MWWSIIIFSSFGFLYLLQNRYYKRIYQEILLYIVMALLLVNFLSRRDISEPFTPIESVISMISVFILSYFFYLFSKSKIEKVVAKQVSYWDVPFECILLKNRDKIISKRGRNELEEQGQEYFYEEIINGNQKTRKIQPLILSDIKKYRGFTIIESLAYFNNINASKLYKIIYLKLYEINDNIEIDIDFDELLKVNKYCVEFFLIDLWLLISTKEIMGIGTLNTYAETKKELELIGALDAVVSNNIKKQGILLFSHYLNFKGELAYV